MKRLLSIVVAAAAATAAASAPAGATTPQGASGTAQATSLVVTDVRKADGNVFLEGVQQGVITGTFTGSWVEHFRVVLHADGSTNFHSVLTFTGVADGCGTGTLEFVVDGQGDGAVTEGRLRTIDDPGAEAHAVLDFVALLQTNTIVYSGTYHCG